MEHGKKRQINWQDGMKLNKNHFANSDYFHVGQQIFNRNLLLNDNNFGILPSEDKSGSSFEIKLSLEGEYIHITKFKISALMISGMAIDIDSDEIALNNIDAENLNLKFRYSDHKEDYFVIMLKLNSFRGIEYGKFDSEDFPIKRPFLLPHFEFIFSPLSKIKESYFSDNFFIITRLKIENKQIVIDDNYIPPVTSILSDKKLIDFHSYVFESMNSIENHLIEIGKKHSKNKTDNFAETLVIISNNLTNYISQVKYVVKHKLLYYPPVDIIIIIKSLANIFFRTIEVRTSIGKDMFMNEVVRILGKSKNEFEEMLKQVINLDYRHYNITDSLDVTKAFIQSLTNIFRTLSEGEHKQEKQFDLKIKR